MKTAKSPKLTDLYLETNRKWLRDIILIHINIFVDSSIIFLMRLLLNQLSVAKATEENWSLTTDSK